MHLIRCDATARMKPTRISGKFKFNLTTVVHCAIYLENWTAPVQPLPPPPPLPNKQILYKSRSESRYKHFEILQPYFNTCISHISKKILTFLVASRRT